MKYYITILALGISFLSNAQQKITFNYDSAGNQLTRTLCINCSSKQVDEIKDVETIVEEDLEQFSEEDDFSYYPNPVKEELYLKWKLRDDNYVTSTQIISITGQVLRTYQSPNTSNTQNILFEPYPSGIYIVVIQYKSGEQKSIKIIKQ